MGNPATYIRGNIKALGYCLLRHSRLTGTAHHTNLIQKPIKQFAFTLGMHSGSVACTIIAVTLSLITLAAVIIGAGGVIAKIYRHPISQGLTHRFSLWNHSFAVWHAVALGGGAGLVGLCALSLLASTACCIGCGRLSKIRHSAN